MVFWPNLSGFCFPKRQSNETIFIINFFLSELLLLLVKEEKEVLGEMEVP